MNVLAFTGFLLLRTFMDEFFQLKAGQKLQTFMANSL
jgi:hypothetical protein